MILTEFYDFKMAVIKWYLNFVLCNFGLKSYLWFQIELQIRLHSPLSSITSMYVHCRQYFHDITDHGDAKSVSYFLHNCKGKSIFWRVQLITSATLILNNNLYCYRMYFVFFSIILKLEFMWNVNVWECKHKMVWKF